MFVSGRISGTRESDAAAAPISASIPDMIDKSLRFQIVTAHVKILELTIVAKTKKRHTKRDRVYPWFCCEE
jgi:hypothetical protein